MSRPAQAFVLVMLGAVLVQLAVTGADVNYVRPGLTPYLIAAGVLFAIMGVTGVVRDLRGDQVRQAAAARRAQARVRTHGPGARTSDHPAGAHAHDHHDWYGHGVGWLLCLPLLLLLLSPPPALGSYAAGRTDARVPRPAGQPAYPPLPATDPAPLALRDYAARAVWDHGRTLTGHRILLTGFVAPSTDADTWYLARLHIVCCAADAQTAKIAVIGSTRRFPTGQWLAVTGTWLTSDPHERDGQVARIRAEDVRAVTQPSQPYE